MRIDRLELRNFKKFASLDLDLHPQFTLLIGENGAGKTSVLDALAVALGIWLVEPPDSTLLNSRRGILPSEIRLESSRSGERELFHEASGGVSVKAIGEIDGHSGLTWERRIEPGKKKASNVGAKDAIAVVKSAFARAKGEDGRPDGREGIQPIIHSAYEQAQKEARILLPVIAYYGAGRAWLPHQKGREPKEPVKGGIRRWSAFYDCLNERIRIRDLTDWFQREAIWAVNRGGTYRLGFKTVCNAVLRCVPDADSLWFDGDRGEIVLSILGRAQPFSNLSAGQRTMLALVADIAIKAVTQNNHLVGASHFASPDEARSEVLSRTPGVVLIDELDVHLHPRWQRRVAMDLKLTFPKIQFVCTSHSPQVIGEVAPEEIRSLEDTQGRLPDQSFGLDSNAILEDVMGAEARTRRGAEAIEAVEDALEDGDLDVARRKLEDLKSLQHGDTRDTARLEATINNLEFLAK